MDARGYGANPRGSTAQCFGQAAVEEFLEEHDMGYIIRAHEKTAEGITVSKGGRVLTVFSTSKDHHLGEGAMSACLLVDDGCIEVITKDPSYIARTERLRLASEQARRGSVSVTLAAAAAAAAADQQQQQHQQHGPVSGGPFSFSDDHLFGEGAHIVQEEVVDVEINVSDQSSAAAAVAAPATVCVTQIVVTTSDAAVAAATAAAAGGQGRPLVLEINDQQLDNSVDSDTPLDDEGTRAVPSLSLTSSTQKLQRRDSMDVGLFRQLRARAPPVVLQPSAEQSRAYCSTTAAQTTVTSEPLRSGDRSASRGSSISNASDASVSNDADSNTSTATVVRKHVRKGSAVSFDLDSESDSDDDEDNFTVAVPAAQPAAVADGHSAVAHSNSVSSSSSSSSSVSSGSGSVTTTTASTTVAPSNGSVVWTDAVDAVSSALKAVGIGSKDSAKSSRDRSCSSSNSSDHSGRSLASQSPARRLRGRGRERLQRQPSPTVS
jgi:hypothetical protein